MSPARPNLPGPTPAAALNRPPDSWLDALRLGCARILVQIADENPEVDEEARTGAYLFSQIDSEGGEVSLAALIDSADAYGDSGEVTAEQIRETVAFVLHDVVCDYLYEHTDDMSGWARWWATVDVEDIVQFIHLARPR